MCHYHQILLIWLVSCSAICFGQQYTPITVRFGNGYDLPEGDRRESFSFLIPVQLSDGTFFYRDTVNSVTLPAFMDPDSAAIADVYYSGKPASTYHSVAWHLVYPYQSPSPTLYLDTTYTFDFTTAPSFSYLPDDSMWITTVARKTNADCRAVYQVEPPGYNEVLKAENMEKAYRQAGAIQQEDGHVAAEYWLRIRQRNFRFADFSYLGNDYRIALYDADVSGNYDDPDDRILLNVAGQPLSAELTDDGYYYSPGRVIHAAGQAFRVVDLEPCGKSLTLMPVDTILANNSIRTGGLLSELAESILVDDSLDLRAFTSGKDYFLLDFWGSWCRGCIQALPELREFQQTYADQVELIGMNYGDPRSQIADLQRHHEMSWPSYSVTKAQANQLGIVSYPAYLLFSSEGKLLLHARRMSKVIQYMNEQTGG